jgi:hypothetical protein
MALNLLMKTLIHAKAQNDFVETFFISAARPHSRFLGNVTKIDCITKTWINRQMFKERMILFLTEKFGILVR